MFSWREAAAGVRSCSCQQLPHGPLPGASAAREIRSGQQSSMVASATSTARTKLPPFAFGGGAHRRPERTLFACAHTPRSSQPDFDTRSPDHDLTDASDRCDARGIDLGGFSSLQSP